MLDVIGVEPLKEIDAEAENENSIIDIIGTAESNVRLAE